MDSQVFSDSTIKSLIAKSFVPVRIDSDQDTQYFSAYGVSYIPTLVILSSSGKEISRYGSENVQQLTQILNKYAN